MEKKFKKVGQSCRTNFKLYWKAAVSKSVIFGVRARKITE